MPRGRAHPAIQPRATKNASPAAPASSPLGGSFPAWSLTAVRSASTTTVAPNAPTTTASTASGTRNARHGPGAGARRRRARRTRSATQAANAAATGPVCRSEPTTATTVFSQAATPGMRTFHAVTRPTPSSTATATAALWFSSSRVTPLCLRTGTRGPRPRRPSLSDIHLPTPRTGGRRPFHGAVPLAPLAGQAPCVASRPRAYPRHAVVARPSPATLPQPHPFDATTITERDVCRRVSWLNG